MTFESVYTNLLQIERVKALHSQGIIHGDIKPDNFTFGVDSLGRPELGLVDFNKSMWLS